MVQRGEVRSGGAGGTARHGQCRVSGLRVLERNRSEGDARRPPHPWTNPGPQDRIAPRHPLSDCARGRGGPRCGIHCVSRRLLRHHYVRTESAHSTSSSSSLAVFHSDPTISDIPLNCHLHPLASTSVALIRLNIERSGCDVAGSHRCWRCHPHHDRAYPSRIAILPSARFHVPHLLLLLLYCNKLAFQRRCRA
ncbi:hypothetical protein GY45DRAFT_254384 [Cubamyces sp. BRFM 1775]|nr:hypothetical protein GY45DRAFT_254384 [Cubamyces sp. BRFM 1775]